VIFLDGDAFRALLDVETGHDLPARKVNGSRMARFSLFLDSSDVDVVCSILSVAPEDRQWLREVSSKYIEIYIKCDIEDLKRRDYKGLYEGAFAGDIANVVGVDIQFPEPVNSDLVLENRTNVSNPVALALAAHNFICDLLADRGRDAGV